MPCRLFANRGSLIVRGVFGLMIIVGSSTVCVGDAPAVAQPAADRLPERLRELEGKVQALMSTGRNREADEVLGQIQELLSGEPGASPNKLLNTIRYRRLLALGSDRVDDAVAFSKEILEITITQYGEDDHRVSIARIDFDYANSLKAKTVEQRLQLLQAFYKEEMVNQLFAARQYERAVQIAGELLDIRQELLGPDHFYTGLAANQLGLAHYMLKQNDAALPHYQAAVTAFAGSVGRTHPEYAAVLRNLALTQGRLGQFAETESNLLAALEAYRKADGPDDLSTLRCQRDLAEFYRKQFRLPEALANVEAVVRGMQALGLEAEVDLATQFNNIGMVYRQVGRPEDSEAAFRKALALWRSQRVPDEAYLERFDNLVELLRERGKKDIAARDIEEACEYLRSLTPGVTALSPNGARLLAQLFHKVGRTDRARTLLLEAIEQFENRNNQDSTGYARTLYQLGKTSADILDHAVAELWLSRAVAAFESDPRVTANPDYLQALQSLANVLLHRHRADEARPHLLKILEIVEAAGPGSELQRHPAHRGAWDSLFMVAHMQQDLPGQRRALEMLDKVQSSEMSPWQDEREAARSALMNGQAELAEVISRRAIAAGETDPNVTENELHDIRSNFLMVLGVRAKYEEAFHLADELATAQPAATMPSGNCSPWKILWAIAAVLCTMQMVNKPLSLMPTLIAAPPSTMNAGR